MRGDGAHQASGTEIRYAQCWEDADVLLDALDVREGDTCLSISSAGDNTLALLTRRPARVIAVDVNPAQLACLELRVAAYRALTHAELLELIGSTPSRRRQALYERCRDGVGDGARRFWDARPEAVAGGIGSAGRFERYLALFRRRVLPLVHSRRSVEALLQGGDRDHRRSFYDRHWNNRRWRLLFRLFFSRFVMGRLGRDRRFFRYVEGPVASRLLDRVRRALTDLDPADNPYLRWILTGGHDGVLPLALRPEHFETIRENLDRLEWRLGPVEGQLAGLDAIDRFNLSDIFESMSPREGARLLEQASAAGRPGGRLVYWNMLVPRRRPEGLADRLRPREELAAGLFARDRAFFYSALVIEEIIR